MQRRTPAFRRLAALLGLLVAAALAGCLGEATETHGDGDSRSASGPADHLGQMPPARNATGNETGDDAPGSDATEGNVTAAPAPSWDRCGKGLTRATLAADEERLEALLPRGFVVAPPARIVVLGVRSEDLVVVGVPVVAPDGRVDDATAGDRHLLVAEAVAMDPVVGDALRAWGLPVEPGSQASYGKLPLYGNHVDPVGPQSAWVSAESGNVSFAIAGETFAPNLRVDEDHRLYLADGGFVDMRTTRWDRTVGSAVVQARAGLVAEAGHGSSAVVETVFHGGDEVRFVAGPGLADGSAPVCSEDEA